MTSRVADRLLDDPVRGAIERGIDRGATAGSTITATAPARPSACSSARAASAESPGAAGERGAVVGPQGLEHPPEVRVRGPARDLDALERGRGFRGLRRKDAPSGGRLDPDRRDLARERVVELAGERKAKGRAVGLGACARPLLDGAPPARDEPDHEAEPEAQREATQERVAGRPPLPQGDAQDERAGTRADRDLGDGGVRSPPRRQPPAEPVMTPFPWTRSLAASATPGSRRRRPAAPRPPPAPSPMSVRISAGQPAPRNEGIVTRMATGTTTSR